MANGERLCFVLGSHRSGTNWITSLISEHPGVQRVTPSMLGYGTLKGGLETGVFLRKHHATAIREMFNKIPWNGMLVEKTVDHVFKAAAIRAVFPECKFVVVKRDPVDTVWSMMKSDWPRGMFPKPFVPAREFLEPYVRALKPLEDTAIVVEFERMVSQKHQELLAVWKCLDLECDETLAYTVYNTCRKGGAYPIGLRGFVRSGNVGDGHAGLSASQVESVREMEVADDVPMW